MSAVLDQFILEKAPGPLVELDPALARARVACARLLDALAAIPDDRSDVAPGRGTANEADVRYGFYRVSGDARCRHLGSPSRARVRPVERGARRGWRSTPLRAGACTASSPRSTDADLDADPGGGEWTIRQTMGHIIGSSAATRGAALVAVAARSAAPPGCSGRLADELFAGLPEEDEEAVGSLADDPAGARRRRRLRRRRVTRR